MSQAANTMAPDRHTWKNGAIRPTTGGNYTYGNSISQYAYDNFTLLCVRKVSVCVKCCHFIPEALVTSDSFMEFFVAEVTRWASTIGKSWGLCCRSLAPPPPPAPSRAATLLLISHMGVSRDAPIPVGCARQPVGRTCREPAPPKTRSARKYLCERKASSASVRVPQSRTWLRLCLNWNNAG